jgi:hypothetical protein
MKKMIMFLLVLVFFGVFVPPAFAYRENSHPSQDSNYSPDAYGHLTRNDNLYKDSDGDGVSNYNDRNDRNSNIF